MSSHTCPAKGCTRKVTYDQLACPTHWRKLPWRLRTDLSRAWRDNDIDAHAEALAAATTWYATHDCGPASVSTDYGISFSGGDCGGSS